MRALQLTSISIRTFRNLGQLDLAPSPAMTVVLGDNGQGKTNLLEAIYLAATTRSFRGAPIADLLGHGEPHASVRLAINLDGESSTQSIGIRKGSRVALVDGKRPTSLAAYATRTPVVLFHPESVQLSSGSGAERRRLLDRVALFFDASHLQAVTDYTHASRSRQRILETHGPAAPSLADWESIMGRQGVLVQEGRTRAASRLRASIDAEFATLLPEAHQLAAEYIASTPNEPEPFANLLEQSRVADLRRRRPSVGPLRDDLRLRIGGREMRATASQGQHRAAVLALKLAELMTIAELRGAMPVVLLDDFSSELDPTRTTTLLRLLKRVEAQVFLTTASPDIAKLVLSFYGNSASVSQMEAGSLKAATT